MSVDPKIEAPLRKMLGHVLRGELEDMYALVDGIGPQMYEAAAALAFSASGYIAVDVPGRWPSEADVNSLAKHAATTKGSQVTEDEIAAYLSRVVLKGESVLSVFGQKGALIPVFALADLIASFSGDYDTQWQYLDAIWNAIDAAAALDSSVPPAVVYAYLKK